MKFSSNVASLMRTKKLHTVIFLGIVLLIALISITLLIGNSVETVNQKSSIFKKIDDKYVTDLIWDNKLKKFVYSTTTKIYSDKGVPISDQIGWKTFNPVNQQVTLLSKNLTVQNISNTIKQKLGVYDNYINVSPSGNKFIFIRAQEDHSFRDAPLTIYKYIQLWYWEKEEADPVFVGDLPFPFSSVYWLDNEQTVLIVGYYESSGVYAQLINLTTHTSKSIFGAKDSFIKDFNIFPSVFSTSPDGKWITMNGSVDDNYSIWLIDRETGKTQRIDSAYSNAKALWSDDSKSFYYIQGSYSNTSLPKNSPVLARFDLVTRNITLLTMPGDINKPIIKTWAKSSDNKFFAFSINEILGGLEEGLWLLDLSSK
jgi:hypothetical protein